MNLKHDRAGSPCPAQLSPAWLSHLYCLTGPCEQWTTFTAPDSVRQTEVGLCCPFLTPELKPRLPYPFPMPTPLGLPYMHLLLDWGLASAAPCFCYVPSSPSSSENSGRDSPRCCSAIVRPFPTPGLSLSHLGKSSIFITSPFNPEQTISESTFLFCLFSSFPGLSPWDLKLICVNLNSPSPLQPQLWLLTCTMLRSACWRV